MTLSMLSRHGGADYGTYIEGGYHPNLNIGIAIGVNKVQNLPLAGFSCLLSSKPHAGCAGQRLPWYDAAVCCVPQVRARLGYCAILAVGAVSKSPPLPLYHAHGRVPSAYHHRAAAICFVGDSDTRNLCTNSAQSVSRFRAYTTMAFKFIIFCAPKSVLGQSVSQPPPNI